MSKISAVLAREILDSRGDPSVEVELKTDDGIHVVASSPSGASVGSHEAVEKRDGDLNRFGGLGVLGAVKNVNEVISKAIQGADVSSQKNIDQTLIDLDGTSHKSRLGANAILATSIAVCKAGAINNQVALFEYIGRLSENINFKIPSVMFNFIEGAKHASNNLTIQEFLAVFEKPSFKESYQMAAEAFHRLGKILKERKLGSSVGFEGGYAPNLPTDEDALSLLVESGQVQIALDLAGVIPDEMNLEEIVKKYPIISLEDPINEDDWEAWVALTATLGTKINIVGDDLLASNVERLIEAVDIKACNSVIVKPNQIGTVSEAIKFANLAKSSNLKTIVSHRSGETEDTFIADFAVGVGSDFVKFGAPSRGERIAKYNRLLRIEEKISGI